jgi:hypothetical protein
MMRSRFQDSIVLNAHALALIQSNQCEEAIAGLKEALSLLQPHLDNCTHEDPYWDSPKRPYYSVPVLSEENLQKSILLSSDNVFNFYPRMFNIVEYDANKFGASKVFVLLLFNLAIAHHVHAVLLHQTDSPSCPEETAYSRQFRLTTILKMYQSVILATRTSLHPEEVGSLLCILIAAANNAGHLNACLHNFKEMQSSLDLEMQLLGLSYGPCAIPEQDYEIFFSSIYVFLEGPGLCLPPAA